MYFVQAQCSECDELHSLARNAKQRIGQIQEDYLKRADDINAMLLEKHKIEVRVHNATQLQQGFDFRLRGFCLVDEKG